MHSLLTQDKAGTTDATMEDDEAIAKAVADVEAEIKKEEEKSSLLSNPFVLIGAVAIGAGLLMKFFR